MKNQIFCIFIIMFNFVLHCMENSPLLQQQKNSYSAQLENNENVAHNLSDEDLIKKYSKTSCKQDCDYFMIAHLALSGGPDYRKHITKAELREIKERMIEDGITDVQLQQSVAQEYMKHKNKVARRAIYYVCGLAVASGITIIITTLKPWQYF